MTAVLVVFPDISTAGYSVGMIVIGYAMWRHQLFVLTPAAVAEEILSAMADPLVLLTADGAIVTANRAALQVSGYSIEELEGRPLTRLFPGTSVDTSGLSSRPDSIRMAGSVREIEASLATKGGAQIPVSLAASVMTGADGVALGIVCISRDISERKLAEQALSEAEEKYRSIVENADDAIIVVQDRRVVYRNRADVELLGQTVSETTERSFLDFVAPEDRERVAGYYEARQRGEQAPNEYEVTRLVRDGQRMPVEVKPRRIEFNGRPATMVMMRDITRRREAESRIRSLRRQLLRVQEEERRSIAHELHDEIGQELTALKYLLENTMKSARTTAEVTLAGAVEHVVQLMDRVRDLSLNLRPTVLDDLGLLPALLWLVDRQTGHGIFVTFEHSGIGSRFDLETEIAVYRVVQEALTNVARHAQTTDVKLAVRSERGAIEVNIEDNGVGFDPDAVSSFVSTGLAGMRERVELLGGDFDVVATPGEGTTIAARLPAGAPAARLDG